MTLPTFLYIGPPKSGSTWLYEVLAQHPDVFLPTLKDLYFFDRHYDRGIDWYAQQFAKSNGQTAIGEISHDYIYSKDACQRINTDLPDVKLVTLLREPRSRAISHFKYLFRFGNVPTDFKSAVAQHDEILECGLYGKYLKPYYDQFAAENIGVFFFDDLKNDSERLAAEIFRFLGVDGSLEIDTHSKVNGHAVSRSILMAQLAKQSAHLARRLGWTELLGRAKRSSLLRGLLFRPTDSAETDFDLTGADEICDAFYADDFKELKSFLPITPPWSTNSHPNTVVSDSGVPAASQMN